MGARPSPPTAPSSDPRLPPRPSPLHAAPPSLAVARARLRRALLPHRERASCHARARARAFLPHARASPEPASAPPLRSRRAPRAARRLGEGAPRCAWLLSPSWILSQVLANGSYPPALQPFSPASFFSGEGKGDAPGEEGAKEATWKKEANPQDGLEMRLLRHLLLASVQLFCLCPIGE